MAKLLKSVSSPLFKRQYKRLPTNTQKKFTKQLKNLVKNYRYPSLRTRKMVGVDWFEARIDIHYRFTFKIEKDSIILMTIGPHDEGLGKK